jgi:uncharacterized membrane protein
VGHVIVALDVVEVGGRGAVAELGEVAQVAGEVRVVGDAPKVALEMTDLHRIETDQGHE